MKFIAILTLLISFCAFADLPRNDLWISASDKGRHNITEPQFNDVVSKVEATYSPLVKAKGGVLKIVKKWSDGTVNAYAERKGNVYQVTMFGGLARHQLVTQDGFMAVLCHELGHHLGGFPKYSDAAWASVEGQSDYWGMLKCMKRVLAKEDNASKIKTLEIPEIVKTYCKAQFPVKAKEALCERVSMAGKSLADLLASLGGTPEPKFETPSTVVVTTTDESHPEAQCRLDSYFAGTLCNVGVNVDISDVDPSVGTCTTYPLVSRPLCWYKP